MDLVEYRRHAPASGDGPVEHLWTVRAPGWDTPRKEVLVPNGRPTMVVCLADPGLRHDPATRRTVVNADSVFGITTRPHVLEQQGPSAYVGLQLKPWGLADLLGRDRLVDEVAPLGEALLRSGPVVAAMRSDATLERAVRRLESFAAELATPLEPRTADTLCRAVRAIEDSGGAVTVAECADVAGTSPDTLYRRFRAATGVGPKLFGEIVRCHRFVGGLLAEAGDSNALLAGLNGYYDQAHAARDFRRFTGMSASEFRRVHHGIAVLMHGSGSVQDPG